MRRIVRARPPLLRALGQCDPPLSIEISDRAYRRVEVYKHDSWAATARYRGAHGDVVCKFNRVQPIFGVPVAWLGRRFARREAFALQQLADVRGIPVDCGPVSVDGRRCAHAVAHAYVAGHPLRLDEPLREDFFPALHQLLEEIHRRKIAFVDLHKRENIIVGDDQTPYLVDFQICFGLWLPFWPNNLAARWMLSVLQRADRYHLAKHVRRHCREQLVSLGFAADHRRPWWIRAHRLIAMPFRRVRRRLLIALGVRAASGEAVTEVFPEEAVRLEWRSAAPPARYFRANCEPGRRAA